MLNITEASEFLGVAKNTLRRWEDEGRIKSHRTTGNHRRYDKQELLKLKSFNKISKGRLTIGYCRVSSSDQKEDLSRQINTVGNYCAARGYQFRIISDLGSGLNYKKKGLKELIEMICSNEVERVVINYKDRLVRFGYEMLEQICQIHSVQIEVINHTEDKSYEEELVEDVLSVITVFSSKLYGSRSRKAKKVIDVNKEMLEKCE